MLSCVRLSIPTVLLLCFTLNFVAAQCTTELGLLSSSNFQKNESVFVCYEDTLKVELSDYQLMEGQQLYYVYHYSENYIDGIYKIDTGLTSGIINDLFSNKVYTTVIATSSNSLYEIDDTCTVFSNTIEANFLDKLSFELDYECRSNFPDEFLEIYYTSLGSLPHLDSTFNYYISGDLNDTLKYKEIDSLTFAYEEPWSIEINFTDGLCTVNEIFRIIDFCFRLPIGLLTTFTGTVINNEHLIKWKMRSEIESAHFILQVSTDGVNFEILDTVQGAGTTSSLTSYEIINTNTSLGSLYYQLLQVEYDGTINTLGIIKVTQYATSVYPNPTKQYLNLHNNGQGFQNLEINITDITGQQIANYTQNQIETTNLGYRLNVAFLSSGIYFMNVMADDFQKIEKFVVEK